MKSILITQCLQNDFVKPIGKYDNLPNLLHIGYHESIRLMGMFPKEGPVSIFMNWANSYSNKELDLIHIRDWHDPNDISQRSHLEHFGDHCLMNTIGADFVFNNCDNENVLVINASGLNDFLDTQLENHLSTFNNQKIRIGVIGVWTEAKISFLAYDIRTRYPQFDIAVCSALTASSSVHNHYASLDQLKKILNIHVYNSIGEFVNFLTWDEQEIEIPIKENSVFPEIKFDSSLHISDTDFKLIKYVFRGSRSVSLKILDGGFSGNLVLGTESVDMNGHSEASHILKIGEQEAIGQERMSFEKVEHVLGNNAPRITDFADSKGRGVLKYRYASMGKGTSSSFQKLFMSGVSLDKIQHYLKTIFIDQLGKFYIASTHEKINLFNYYGFNLVTIDNIQKNVDEIYGKKGNNEELELINGLKFPNPVLFYKNELHSLSQLTNSYAYLAYVHGDLNGANIIIDAQENIWIIDFFHTHRGHVIKDLVKLENDLLYIYTSINSDAEFLEALKISEILFSTRDLGQELPPIEATTINLPTFVRTYETLRMFRSFYPSLIKSDRSPTQLFIAQLRYSMHTLVFDECNDWQKKWALYNSGHFCKIISSRIMETGPLRIDRISKNKIGGNCLGLTILPGRQDFSRNLDEDIKEIKKQGIDVIIPLLTKDEMESYGVPDLIETYRRNNLEVLHLPIVDQKIPGREELRKLLLYIDKAFSEGKNILLHCVGGLGRSGLVAACYLKHIGFNSAQAINFVREIRSPRAIETKIQEDFVKEFI